MAGTAKDLGSNLTRTCFFSNGKSSVSNKRVGQFLSAYLLLAWLSHHGIIFFATRIFLNVAFTV